MRSLASSFTPWNIPYEVLLLRLLRPSTEVLLSPLPLPLHYLPMVEFLGNENLMGKGKDGKIERKRRGNEVWSGWWCIVDARSLLEESNYSWES